MLASLALRPGDSRTRAETRHVKRRQNESMTSSLNSFGYQSTLEVEAARSPTTPCARTRLESLRRRATARTRSRCSSRTSCATRTASRSRPRDIEALARWAENPSRHGEAAGDDASEIAFTPERVLMQDLTGVPAVVDLAAMRDAIVALGGDAEQDQSAGAGRAGHRPLGDRRALRDFATSFDENVAIEYERNIERYTFLKWAQSSFEQFRVVPPGMGICHQVNLEHLAQRRLRARRRRLPRHARRHRLAHDDGQRARRARLGRRRHRGRGRHARPADLDADPAGRRASTLGRHARGRDGDRRRAHDHRAAAPARRRRQVRRGLRAGRVASLSLETRATIGNMSPEYGATCDDLPDRPGDARLPRLHRPHRRTSSPSSRPTPRRRGSGTTSTRPSRSTPSTSSSTSTTRRAEPRRTEAAPGPRLALGRARRVSRRARARAHRGARRRGGRARCATGAVVIAAITSCTNTSNPSVMVAAGLVAKRAVELGLTREALGEDVARPGQPGRHRLPRARRTGRAARRARLLPRRLRLHDLHRQLRTAARRASRRPSTSTTSRSCRCSRATATSRVASTPT